jgi:GH24 family phage-related lysozyme (muramidase)
MVERSSIPRLFVEMNMQTRRVVLGFGLPLSFLSRRALGQGSTTLSFDEAFAEALKKPDQLENGRQLREGWETEFDVFALRGVAPRYEPSSVRLSDRAIDLIITFEVTSQNLYEQKYQGPTWPGGDSGTTIGIGYDIGYVTVDWLTEDWKGNIPDTDIRALQSACGVHGSGTREQFTALKSIEIGWTKATQQFLTTGLPRYTAEVLDEKVLPNANKLPLDCLGALVSLDYNRGPSFRAVGDRYREMRAIRLHMVNQQYDLIPSELRSMKRLWQNDPALAGLLIRRDLEAALFEQGLKK